jgi:hypothetical protein
VTRAQTAEFRWPYVRPRQGAGIGGRHSECCPRSSGESLVAGDRCARVSGRSQEFLEGAPLLTP